MKPSRTLSSIALCLSLAIPGVAAAGVPMFNATCPGGVEVHADEGGPVYFNGKEAQLKRFNDEYFEARDAGADFTLSISRTPDGGVSLSYTGKGGANGVCSVSGASSSSSSSSSQRREEPRDTRRDASYASGSSGAAQEVTCESHDQKLTECDMDTQGEVQLVRKLSRGACEEGTNWGLSRHSVWVKDGCRAVFRNVSHDGRSHDRARPMTDTSTGSTLLGACNVRAKEQGALVTRVPVNDQVTELIVDYPDGRYLCMVRNDGFVQSLTRLRKN